jgi:hypothetical protein
MPDSMNMSWEELPAAVRGAIERHTGAVSGTRPGGEGMSTAVRLILDTEGGGVLIKGTRPGSGRLVRERLALGAEEALRRMTRQQNTVH